MTASLLPAKLRTALGPPYRKWLVDRRVAPLPKGALVPLDEAGDVLLLCSRWVPYFDAQLYLQELAFSHELANRGRSFAVTDDTTILFDKSVIWFLPHRFMLPMLWDYSRQVWDFATGLERQGNRLLCSAGEILYWENKAYMHRRLSDCGVVTPRTVVLAADSWHTSTFDIEPVLIKEEHSAGSSGVHHFRRAVDAQEFVRNYAFRPHESLLMQEVVPGATRDLRLTMVGDTPIRSATFWRIKGTQALANQKWTTTATTHGSTIEHGNVPDGVVPQVAEHMRRLGIRTAGIDLMWEDDDVSGPPLMLELSPYYQPNPPKPERYRDWSYKEYKQKPFVKDGYLLQQYLTFREISGQILDQRLF